MLAASARFQMHSTRVFSRTTEFLVLRRVHVSGLKSDLEVGLSMNLEIKLRAPIKLLKILYVRSCDHRAMGNLVWMEHRNIKFEFVA